MAVNDVPTKSGPLSSFMDPKKDYPNKPPLAPLQADTKSEISTCCFKSLVPYDVEYWCLAISHKWRIYPRKIRMAPTSCEVANYDEDESGELPSLVSRR
jgi:hypothetical protein